MLSRVEGRGRAQITQNVASFTLQLRNSTSAVSVLCYLVVSLDVMCSWSLQSYPMAAISDARNDRLCRHSTTSLRTSTCICMKRPCAPAPWALQQRIKRPHQRYSLSIRLTLYVLNKAGSNLTIMTLLTEQTFSILNLMNFSSMQRVFHHYSVIQLVIFIIMN